ncbi:hypothetical protein JXM67_10260 [candidate division WOR-3 bacterium]|nr:hypothetical protein [candidate division WOR-3 bacterium]
MQNEKPRKSWYSAIVIGLVLITAVLAIAEQSESSDELSFLAETKPPDYLYVAGDLVITDSLGSPVMMSPFRFYWEKGSYALDARYFGGGLFLFMRGVGDTVWVYDFMHEIKLVSLVDQSMGRVTGLPFSPRDVLPLFNLFTEGFFSDVDTSYHDNSVIVVRAKDGTLYHFDAETKHLKECSKGTRRFSFSDYRSGKKGYYLPYLVIFNEGLLVTGATGTQLEVSEVSYKPQTENNLLLSKEPKNMPRAFDIRPDHN